MAPLQPEQPSHAVQVADALRERLESVAPGDVGSISCKDLGQNALEFEQTLSMLHDLENAGLLRLGALERNGTGADRVEFERLR